ncbi:NAD(P)(+) transhydrogenase (Re/Si-specific) subunit beta [Luteimicrobium subarcticum]|uniref:NAD(P) transhydrogenase subunit beta n=1 Tax=Luteimicrobium subarcticum TaxID=620910 RepID=A0A2M8WJ69_9MICO|nr:NAD(P)(+) transhydrogenase (Re/Si-specific) subunit beta [Luteimicrobium subarcticum]PJI90977.1 NAD(P) transhydrogenase subunit beta [Luteimicrobium subarcticum]
MSAVATTTWLVYLAAAVCFVLGLHLMRSPGTARRGNLLSAGGMAAAVLATVLLLVDDGDAPAVGWHGGWWAAVALVGGIVVGGGYGWYSARRVKMTAMPQLVSLFNAVGGGAATAVALADFLRFASEGTGSGPALAFGVPVALDVLIGSVTFSGSLVAAGKLQGIVRGAPIVFRGARVALVAAAVVATGCAVVTVASGAVWALWVLLVAALVFGVLMVLPIGGADMPVVISLLNAFTGLAVAMAGFVVDNQVMIVAGALVGASGSILTKLMADAMNRSIVSILVGGFGTGDAGPGGAGPGGPGGDGTVRSIDADDVAIQLAYASSVVLVPGYGLAAAQAQHELAALAAVLADHGVRVGYAIHPVAGRMPGHMNVLLAEANVPYEQMLELDAANTELDTCDVALVVGANDVTNPAARRPGTAISGMPILDVDHARSVVVIKRSMGHGYAGIENELYTDEKTGMFFTDAKQGLAALVGAVEQYVS